MSFTPGENVGHYRILEQLGQGGMATVYKAYHATLDRYVAIKVLHPAFLEGPSFQTRFLREARLVAKLEHPNIVPIYDYAEHERQPYLVMKYIEGETLKTRLARSLPTADEIARIVKSVGQALAYAHQQGILHRDVKPSNIMLASDGQIYLADFGLARIAQAGESTLTSDMILGTPQYISPEQALGKKDLDAGTDIYSFGVMLYEMIVGRVPFSADTPFSIIHDHIYTPLPLPRSINPNVPEDVERILLKCLAKDRNDRYETINDLVEAFLTTWNVSGGIGHAATLAMPVRPQVPVSDTASTLPPASGLEPKPSVERETSPSPPEPPEPTQPQKKSTRILTIAATGLLLLCCLAAVLLLRNRYPRISRLFPPTVTVSEPSPVPPTAPAPFIPPNPEQPLPPEVVDARQAVENAPDDPYARLRLALAYYDAGMEPSYVETLAQAGEIAGKNQAFFFDASRALMEHQAWVGAAAMCLRGINLQPVEKPVPDDIRDLFQHSIYKASQMPDFQAYIPLERIGVIEQPLRLVAESRYDYYNGDKVRAHRILREVRQMKPDLHLARLLEAEYKFEEGRVDEARALFLLLKSDLSTPEWILVEVRAYLEKIP